MAFGSRRGKPRGIFSFRGAMVLNWPMVKRNQPPKPADEASGSSRYWSGAHTVYRLRFHLVWTPKSAGNGVSAYRKRVLEGAVAVRVEELFRQACEVNNWLGFCSAKYRTP